jgi:hypothetical protein
MLGPAAEVSGAACATIHDPHIDERPLNAANSMMR